MRKLKGFTRMLQILFPNVNFDESKSKNEGMFSFQKREGGWRMGVKYSKYFVVFEKRRKFFVKFAKTRRFDPLVPENWYTQKQHSLTSTAVISFPHLPSLLRIYSLSPFDYSNMSTGRKTHS